jgi:hypothetical protein
MIPEIADFLAAQDRIIRFPHRSSRRVVAAFVLVTHFTIEHAWGSIQIPYLNIYGPRGSGKSPLAHALSCASYGSLLVMPTPASLYHELQGSHFGRCLVIDEGDEVRLKRDIVNLLLAGNRPGPKVKRVIGGKLKRFRTYGPKVFVTPYRIGSEWGSFERRVIPVESAVNASFESDADSANWNPKAIFGNGTDDVPGLRRRLSEWTKAHVHDVRAELKVQRQQRDYGSSELRSLWTPMFAAASVAGLDLSALEEHVQVHAELIGEEINIQLREALEELFSELAPGEYSSAALREMLGHRHRREAEGWTKTAITQMARRMGKPIKEKNHRHLVVVGDGSFIDRAGAFMRRNFLGDRDGHRDASDEKTDVLDVDDAVTGGER